MRGSFVLFVSLLIWLVGLVGLMVGWLLCCLFACLRAYVFGWLVAIAHQVKSCVRLLYRLLGLLVCRLVGWLGDAVGGLSGLFT